MTCDGGCCTQGLIMISGLHVNALVAAAVDETEGHGWESEEEARAS